MMQIALAAMKAKRLELDFEGRLQVAIVSFKGEVEKLDKEKESLVVELRKVVDGLKIKLQNAQQRNKDFEEELRRDRSIRELSTSKLTNELNKVKKELQRAQGKLKSAEAELEKAKEE